MIMDFLIEWWFIVFFSAVNSIKTHNNYNKCYWLRISIQIFIIFLTVNLTLSLKFAKVADPGRTNGHKKNLITSIVKKSIWKLVKQIYPVNSKPKEDTMDDREEVSYVEKSWMRVKIV